MPFTSDAVAGPSTYPMAVRVPAPIRYDGRLSEERSDLYQPHQEQGDGFIDNATPAAGANKRGKSGCITCRLRKKRCDELKPVCATCTRLGIECMGYGAKRPKWLREKENAKKVKQSIKQTVSSRRTSKVKESSEDAVLTFDQVDQSQVEVNEGHGRSGSSSSSLDPANLDITMDEKGGNLSEMGNAQSGIVQETSNYWQLASTKSNGAVTWDMNHPVDQQTMIEPAYPDPSAQETTIELSSLPQTEAIPTIHHAYSNRTVVADPTLYPPDVGASYQATMDAPPAMIGPADLGAVTPSMPMTDVGMEAIWALLMGHQPQQPMRPISAPSSPVTPFLTIPSPTAGLISAPTPNLQYLQYFLSVVLPIQYRVIGISMSMADLVAPLALSRNEVLHSVSALAALHMFAKRTKKRPASSSPRFGPFDGGSPTSTRIHGEHDADARVASISHQKTMERLRFISPQDLTAEEIIISVLFAISYQLFSGGTSKHLHELVAILRRCLSAALLSSPELLPGGGSTDTSTATPSPWKRYRQLIEHMIWTDIIAAVTQNKATRLLSVYRRLLDHLPADTPGTTGQPILLMDRVMGCDSTTLLALCEVIALSEWKERAEEAGCLSYRELLSRAGSVEKILNDRAWKESHLDRPVKHGITPEEYQARELRRIMSDVFFGSVKVLLAVVINGPFPRVPEIAAAVQDTMEALHRLDIQYPNEQIHRALVLPITVAGCHCETPSQQAYFKRCFDQLGPEAKAFGNTGPALELMEEVWRKRAAGGPSAKVDWRKTMVDLGWEEGVMLI